MQHQISKYLNIATLICSKLTSEKAHLLQAKNSLASDLEKLLKHGEVSICLPCLHFRVESTAREVSIHIIEVSS